MNLRVFKFTILMTRFRVLRFRSLTSTDFTALNSFKLINTCSSVADLGEGPGDQKKKKMTEGRKASRASKSTPP